jgi:hypothetical protein
MNMFLIFFLVFHLNINNLSDLDAKLPIDEVEVSGFLYNFQPGLYILSSESNLKSCCVGSDLKTSNQIFCHFEDQEFQSKGLVRVCGYLERKDDRFILKNSSIKKNKRFPIKSVLIAFLGIILLVYVRKKSIKK